MAAELWRDLSRASDANNNPLPGATWTFYATGTTTPQAVYADADLDTSLGSVVTADAGGKFAPIFLDTSLLYRAVLKNAGGTTITDIDPANVNPLAPLAESGGSGLVGYQHPNAGTIERDAEDKLSETLSVRDFGAVGDGATDDYAAIQAAIDAAFDSKKEVLFPQGNYLISAGLVVNVGRIHLRGEGIVVIDADFDGGALLSFIGEDGGSPTIRYGGSVKNIWLKGNGSANQNGLHLRNFAHMVVSDVAIRDIAGKGFLIESAVFCVFDRLIADRQNIGGSVFPTHAVYLDEGDYGATTACYFKDNIIEEGTSHGFYLAKAANCSFVGGGAEGLTGTAWGVYISADSQRNTFNEFYCEQNAGGDFDIYGSYNYFVGCEAYAGDPGETVQFNIANGATGNIIEKCGTFTVVDDEPVALTTIVIHSGATDNVIRDCDLHELDDSGTNTLAENYGDALNNKTRAMTRLCLKGLINAADDAAAATAGVPVGYGYHASGVVRVRLT